MNKNLFVYAFMLVILSFSVLGECVTTVSDGSDFMQINQTSYNTISMTENQKFTSFEYFTPRLNFTHVVYESLDGQMANTNYTIQWTMVGNDTYTSVNSSFTLKNGSTTIPASNYTIYSTDNHTFKIGFRDSRYNGTELLASWNRQFVKNVDDIYLNATGMTGMVSFSTFIDQNTPTSYGEDKTFRPHPYTYYGDSINLSNWAVGWNYEDNSNCSACQGVSPFLLNAILTVFILGMLVFLGFSLYSGANFKTIIGVVVGFIVLLIAMLIIKGVLAGVCVA